MSQPCAKLCPSPACAECTITQSIDIGERGTRLASRGNTPRVGNTLTKCCSAWSKRDLNRSDTVTTVNISGRSRSRNDSQCSLSAVGRLPGQRWILGAGLRVGGPGKPPFWRTLRKFCKGLGPVTLKINTQHTPPYVCTCIEVGHVSLDRPRDV